MVNRFPADLARDLCNELKKGDLPCPSVEILTELLETLFFASLKTEEGRPFFSHVVYLDPNNPDPKPPQVVRSHRWQFVRLVEPIPFNTNTMPKLAPAADPRTSSLVVYPDGDGLLSIHGFVDQGNSYFDMMNFEADSGFARPGLFQASIVGIGQIAAFIRFTKVGELRCNSLISEAADVLRDGPVLRRLQPGIRAHIAAIRNSYSGQEDRIDNYVDSTQHTWIAALSRILLRVKNLGHGGAVLITPDENFVGLDVKYRLEYPRLRSALVTRGNIALQRALLYRERFSSGRAKASSLAPKTIVLSDRIRDSDEELNGTIWFISLLSRVDGLVLLRPNLEVVGFGTEITISEAPEKVYVARDARATKARLREYSYHHFGTRHRSMFRYCARINNAVGFVISQDGDVRVVTQYRDQVVFWENIRLSLEEFLQKDQGTDSAAA